MKYTVTVTIPSQSILPDKCSSAAVLVEEIFRQSFDELDLGKLAVALNTKPRGRPAKKREGAQ